MSCFLAVKWEAGEVTKLRCRACNNTFKPGTAPASCAAPGYTPTTQQNVHSYVSVDVLSAVANQSLCGLSQQSDAELQKTIGQGTFWELPVVANFIPLQSLRDLLQLSRAEFAFPFAVLRGYIFPCVACGNEVQRAWGDACVKSMRFANAGGGSDTVFGLPGSIILDPRRTGAAMDVLHAASTEKDPERGICRSSAGTSHWTAGSELPKRVAIHQCGHYFVACSHFCVHCALEMTRPESVRGHMFLALLWAWIHGCKFFFNDCTCMICNHVRASKNRSRDIGAALCALFDVPVKEADTCAAVLKVDESFAVFTILRAGEYVVQ